MRFLSNEIFYLMNTKIDRCCYLNVNYCLAAVLASKNRMCMFKLIDKPEPLVTVNDSIQCTSVCVFCLELIL